MPWLQSTVSGAGVVVDFTIRIGWPQLELGAFATSPIRTTSAAVTRNTDVPTAINLGITPSSVSLFVEWTPQAPDTYATAQIAVTLGATSNRIQLYKAPSVTTGVCLVTAGGVPQYQQGAAGGGSGTPYKQAATIMNGTQWGAVNGVAAADGTGTIPSFSTLTPGGNGAGGQPPNGILRKLAVWINNPVPKSNLQALTGAA